MSFSQETKEKVVILSLVNPGNMYPGNFIIIIIISIFISST